MNDQLRHIAHFDLDSFFVSVEILNDPSLKGKPVLVGGSDRGVVAACSYEARKFGIRSAMPMKQAKKLCPHAIVVNGMRGEYSRYSRWVTDIIASKVPLFEKARQIHKGVAPADHEGNRTSDFLRFIIRKTDQQDCNQ